MGKAKLDLDQIGLELFKVLDRYEIAVGYPHIRAALLHDILSCLDPVFKELVPPPAKEGDR